MLTITQNTSYNGFLLESEVCIAPKIALLVGKNGSGKTRFFQSLMNGNSTIQINGTLLNRATDVVSILSKDINPHYGMSYDHSHHMNTMTATIRSYESHKEIFSKPFDPDSSYTMTRLFHATSGGLQYVFLYKLVQFIAKKVGKNPSELSQEDILLHYEEPLLQALGGQNIAGIFNMYVKKLHDNKYNQWRRSMGEDVTVLFD